MKSPGRIFFTRLVLPAAGLLVLLVLKTPLVRNNIANPEARLWLDAILIFFIAIFFLRVVDAVWLSWYSHRGQRFPLPRLLHSVLLAVLYLAAFFIILKAVLDVSITPFLATSALLTMILGLAFQDLLQNIISGLSLHFIKSFNKGDWIEIAGREGIVLDINWRETRIFDRYSNVIVIPNKSIALEKLTNYSYPGKTTALTIPVRVSFSASPAEVFKAITCAAQDCQAVLTRPQPEAHLLAYEDFGVSYAVKFWISDYTAKYTIMAEVGRNIWFRFQRAGIEIPLPVNDKLRDVLRSAVGRETGRAKPSGEPAASILKKSPFLKESEDEGLLVPEDRLEEFAEKLPRLRFAPGEVIFRQGDPGENCYIVAAGRIKGTIRTREDGKELTVEFTVEPYSLFGEMSLFTGMPRTATGRADTETELIEIRREAFSYLLELEPSLAESIAEVISRRNRENRENLEKIRELSQSEIDESVSKQSILARLKSWLGK